MDNYKSFYEVLGVSKDATLREIKDAYRKKAMEFHPDVNPNKENCHKMMCLINEIYSVLRNPISRTAYDKSLETRNTEVNSSPSTEESEESVNVKKKTYPSSSTYQSNIDYNVYNKDDYNNEEQEEFINLIEYLKNVFLVDFAYLFTSLDDNIQMSELFEKILDLEKEKFHKKGKSNRM